MSKPTVFEFQDYRTYLSSWINSHVNGGRGIKSRIAEQARCHLAYISQVLSGKTHFSLEQADALHLLLGHGEEEANYFLLLVEHARASTPSLIRHFERRMQKVLEQRAQLKNRFTDKKSLNSEDQVIYYSHWAYCAVHMVVLNPAFRSPDSISKYLDLSVSKTSQVLDFLTSAGLVKKEGGVFVPGDVRIHLGHDSPMISKHHTNWRIQAVKALERETSQELHYSGVISVSLTDLPKVREVLIRALEDVRKIVKDSADEAVYCYTMDLFGLGRES